jgi:hypothetical protein
MFFLSYFSTTLGPKYIIYYFFDLNAYNIPCVLFGALGVFWHCIHGFQPSTFWCPLLLKKQFMFNLVHLLFLTQFFDTHVKLFVVILSFLLKIHMFLLFPIFHYPWCCLNVFLLLKKLRSSLNYNIPLVWIFIKDIQIWECLLH